MALEHRPVFSGPRGQWPKQRRIQFRAGWLRPALAKARNPNVSTEGLFPFCWNGSEFGPAALLIYTSALSLLTLLKWKRSSGKDKDENNHFWYFALGSRLSHQLQRSPGSLPGRGHPRFSCTLPASVVPSLCNSQNPHYAFILIFLLK